MKVKGCHPVARLLTSKKVAAKNSTKLSTNLTRSTDHIKRNENDWFWRVLVSWTPKVSML